jgi:hypothetical protein
MREFVSALIYATSKVEEKSHLELKPDSNPLYGPLPHD